MKKYLLLLSILCIVNSSFWIVLAQDDLPDSKQQLISNWVNKVLVLIEKHQEEVPSRQMVSLINFYVDRKLRSSRSEEVRSIVQGVMIELFERWLADKVAIRYTSPTWISLILPTDLSSAIYYTWTWSLPYEYEWWVNIKNNQASQYGAENNFNIQVSQLDAEIWRQQLEETMTLLANERIKTYYISESWEQAKGACLYDFSYSSNTPWIELFSMWRDMKYGDECQWSWLGWVRNKQTWKFWYRTGWWHDPSFYIYSPYIEAERLPPKQGDLYWDSMMYVFDSIVYQSITID